MTSSNASKNMRKEDSHHDKKSAAMEMHNFSEPTKNGPFHASQSATVCDQSQVQVHGYWHKLHSTYVIGNKKRPPEHDIITENVSMPIWKIYSI